MKNPWVKLWRNVLNDEKISFIVRRYGHECLTFWIGVLTKCEDGILEMDEEIFAELCLVEWKRYEEIRSVFVKRGLLGEDESGRLVVLNWGEYQVGESTERVRRYRERARNVTETPMKRDETKTERLEGEGEGEGEGERAPAREDPPPPADPVPEEKTQDSPAAQVARDWYEGLAKETWTNVEPGPKDWQLAEKVVAVCNGDLDQARALRAEYFRSWRDLWWAVNKADKDKPRDKKTPDFDFRAYCAHVSQVAARLAVKAKDEARYVQAPPPTPVTPEEIAAANAEADRIMQEAKNRPGIGQALAAAG